MAMSRNEVSRRGFLQGVGRLAGGGGRGRPSVRGRLGHDPGRHHRLRRAGHARPRQLRQERAGRADRGDGRSVRGSLAGVAAKDQDRCARGGEGHAGQVLHRLRRLQEGAADRRAYGSPDDAAASSGRCISKRPSRRASTCSWKSPRRGSRRSAPIIETAELAQQKKLSIVAGTQRRHSKKYLETIKRIHDGPIGEIVAAQAYWNGADMLGYWKWWDKENRSDMEWQFRNWHYFTWICGDHIVEQHVHNLDVMNWALQGHPEQVHRHGRPAARTGPTLGNIFDHFAVEFEYPNGVRVDEHVPPDQQLRQRRPDRRARGRHQGLRRRRSRRASRARSPSSTTDPIPTTTCRSRPT